MGRSFALILAAAVVVAASAGAQAADLLPPPPPVEPPPPADFGGWYLRGDVGVGALQLYDWRSTLQPNLFGQLPNGPVWLTHYSIGDTAFAGGGFGYQYNSWLRGDLTAEYRINTSYRAGQAFIGFFPPNCVGGCFGADHYQGNISTVLLMANGYVDLGTWYGVTPFIGGGVGAAFHNFGGLTDYGFGVANGGIGVARDLDTTNFAWAAMAGFAFNVTPNFKVELGYRYVDMGRITSNPILCGDVRSCFNERHGFYLASHDIRLGFRYILAAPIAPPVLPPPPPPPLVRKY